MCCEVILFVYASYKNEFCSLIKLENIKSFIYPTERTIRMLSKNVKIYIKSTFNSEFSSINKRFYDVKMHGTTVIIILENNSNL
jgi:hypothetical protein